MIFQCLNEEASLHRIRNSFCFYVVCSFDPCAHTYQAPGAESSPQVFLTWFFCGLVSHHEVRPGIPTCIFAEKLPPLRLPIKKIWSLSLGANCDGPPLIHYSSFKILNQHLSPAVRLMVFVFKNGSNPVPGFRSSTYLSSISCSSAESTGTNWLKCNYVKRSGQIWPI